MYGKYKDWRSMDIAEIQPKRKEVPYTVSLIGGPEQLKQWRKDQALLKEARDAYMKPIKEAVRLKAIAMVEEQNHDLKFTKEERAEINYRKALSNPQKSPLNTSTCKAHFEVRKTLKDTVKDAIAKLWKNAFDN